MLNLTEKQTIGGHEREKKLSFFFILVIWAVIKYSELKIKTVRSGSKEGR